MRLLKMVNYLTCAATAAVSPAPNQLLLNPHVHLSKHSQSSKLKVQSPKTFLS